MSEVEQSKVELIKKYLTDMCEETKSEIHDPWTEGFLFGLVKVNDWGITYQDYDELVAWLQSLPAQKK